MLINDPLFFHCSGQLRCLAALGVLIGSQACGDVSNAVGASSTVYKPTDHSYVVAYDSRGRGAYVQDRDGILKVCAEPAPDVAANLAGESSSSFDTSASALISALTLKAAASGQATEKMTSVVADVAPRTEVLLVLREALYRICEMNLNANLDKDGTVRAFDYVLRTARQLGQRDNVAKLIGVIADEKDPKMKEELLRTVVAMSYAESVAGSTGIAADPAQGGAATILKDQLERLYDNKQGQAIPGGNRNQ